MTDLAGSAQASEYVPEEFRAFFLESLDDAFGLLGKELVPVFYFHLGERGVPARARIPENLVVFSKVLRQICGSGGIIIERQIVKRFFTKLGVPYHERLHYGLIDYLNELKSTTRS